MNITPPHNQKTETEQKKKKHGINNFSTQTVSSTYHRSVFEKEAEVEPYLKEISDEPELQEPQPTPKRYRAHSFISTNKHDYYPYSFLPSFFFLRVPHLFSFVSPTDNSYFNSNYN